MWHRGNDPPAQIGDARNFGCSEIGVWATQNNCLTVSTIFGLNYAVANKLDDSSVCRGNCFDKMMSAAIHAANGERIIAECLLHRFRERNS